MTNIYVASFRISREILLHLSLTLPGRHPLTAHEFLQPPDWNWHPLNNWINITQFHLFLYPEDFPDVPRLGPSGVTDKLATKQRHKHFRYYFESFLRQNFEIEEVRVLIRV